jgi:cholesterol oxidase
MTTTVGDQRVYDYVIIGSGFGGAVCAARLSEKGYSVLVLEKGKRFRDLDFATTNWQFWKYVWMPVIRAHGIMQISLLKGMMVLHGAGVGGGSLGYANVLEIPNAETFATPAWNQPLAWGERLEPYYHLAQRMLGAVQNPTLWPADHTLRQLAQEAGQEATFRATEVGVFFGEEGKTSPDPYFAGAGPERSGCRQCGACMIGCRHNAKNTLPKNYLYFAEKQGAQILAEAEVVDVRPVSGSPAGERYAVDYRSSTGFSRKNTGTVSRKDTGTVSRKNTGTLFRKPRHCVRARNVIFSAGVMGTMALLLRLRDVTGSLPQISQQLGNMIRTNSEALLGSVARKSAVDYSKGVAITSIYNLNETTRVEPVRYPDGSSLMRLISAPLVDLQGGIGRRLLDSAAWALRHPLDFARGLLLPGWAHNTTILLIMQNLDNRLRVRLGRSLYTLGRRGLVALTEPGFEVSAQVKGSHALVRAFAGRTDGVAMGSASENLLNLPTTAHILGGAPIGVDAEHGVVDERFEIHAYPGLFIIDGSVVPANPGVNPSLTIAALAEYATSQVPEKGSQIH